MAGIAAEKFYVRMLSTRDKDRGDNLQNEIFYRSGSSLFLYNRLIGLAENKCFLYYFKIPFRRGESRYNSSSQERSKFEP